MQEMNRADLENLLELDEEDLTVQLGLRSQDWQNTGEAVDSLDDLPVPRGDFDDLLKSGQDFFEPLSGNAYKILCSDIGANSDLAKELSKLMDQKTTEAATQMTSLITPLLVGNIGLPSSIAVVVATLIVKKIAKGTSDLVCTNWQSSLKIT